METERATSLMSSESLIDIPIPFCSSLLPSSSSFPYPTPEYFHCLTESRFRNHVYEPEADTFLFLEALEKEREKILFSSLTKKPITRCIEVGCGSGTVITHLHTLLCGIPTSLLSNIIPSSADLLSCYHTDEKKASGKGKTSSEETREKEVLHKNALTIITSTRTGSKTILKNMIPALSSSFSATPPMNASTGAPPLPFLSPLVSPVTFIAVDTNPVALEATAKTWCETGRKWFDTTLPFAVDCRHTSLKNLNEKGDLYIPSSGTILSSRHNTDASLCSLFCPVLYLVEGDLQLDVNVGRGMEARQDNVGQPFDVILFNPPYVPTSQEELDAATKKKDLITAAWCGGPRGRVVLDRFLRLLPTYLACPGRCYIVLIRENDVEDVRRFVLDELFHQSLGESTFVGNNAETMRHSCPITTPTTTRSPETSSDMTTPPQVGVHIHEGRDSTPVAAHAERVPNTENTLETSRRIFLTEVIEFYEVMTRYTGEHLGVYCIARHPREGREPGDEGESKKREWASEKEVEVLGDGG